MARVFVRTLLCLAASLWLASSLYAQLDYGSISGFAKDPSGAVIPKAKVTIKNEATDQERTTVTNDAGYYVVTNLSPGLYTVTIDAPGFKQFTTPHNKLDASSTLAIDGNLTVGNNTESVEVTATAAVLQTESGAVQKEVTGTQVQAQELNGRNPLYMGQLLPGLRSGSTMGDFNFSVGSGQPFNVNGARPQDTAVTFDGAPALRTRANGAVIGVADVDAVQEIQVLTADYSAEYGRAAGGQLRVISKTGTRDFHGSAYEYFRNSDMNANTWQRNLSTSTNFAQPFRYNDFGFTFGGPAWVPKMNDKWRERLFFFVAEDWIRYRNTDTQTQTVPTMAMRQGDFSQLLGPNPFYSGSRVIYDPSTCPSISPLAASCTPFPGNIIPTNRLSPNGVGILSAYPTPTPGYQVGTVNWIAQAAHPYNQRKGTVNIDIQPSDKHHIFGRRTDASYWEFQPFDQGSGETAKYFIRPNQTNTAGWTWTVNPSMVNEARVTFSLDDVYIPVDTAEAGFNRSQFGINYPFLFGSKDIPGKIPTVNVPSPFYGLAGGPYPSHSSGPIWTAGDSLTKVYKNHTFKVGVSFEYSGENDGDQINVATVPGGSNNQNGTFVFTDNGTGRTSGIGLANLALGVADSYTEIGPRAYTIWRGWMWEGFAQDSWKVTEKLHIDYGLRWTEIQGYHPLWGNADYFDGALYNPSQAVQVDRTTGNVILGTGNPYNGVVIPGLSGFPSSAMGRVLAASSNICDNASCSGLFDPNLSRNYINTDNVWQPRVGIAYSITPKTVVRAGAGRFATRMGLIDNVFPGGNSPFQPFVTVNNVSVDNPGASLTSGTAAALTITTLNPHLKPPEAWNWNATFERQLPWESVLSVAYVAHRGLHAWQVYDINQPTAGALAAAPAGTSVNYLRPYKGYAAIQEEESGVNSTYNSLQISWNRRFVKGLLFGASYTLSKSMDGGSNYRDIVPDTYNTSNLWGPSEYDTRDILILNYVYDLPFFKNASKLSGKMLGGWEIAGTMQFQTGTPCGIGTNNDFASVGEYGSFGCGSQGQFWTLNGPVQINTGAFAGPSPTSSSPRYFTANVSQPAAGTFNLQPGVRDSVYQPGLQDWNIGLLKTFAVTERSNLQFRAEAYDFINHPNLSGPQLTPTSSQFGMITSKTTLARNLQLSLRFFF